MHDECLKSALTYVSFQSVTHRLQGHQLGAAAAVSRPAESDPPGEKLEADNADNSLFVQRFPTQPTTKF